MLLSLSNDFYTFLPSIGDLCRFRRTRKDSVGDKSLERILVPGEKRSCVVINFFQSFLLPPPFYSTISCDEVVWLTSLHNVEWMSSRWRIKNRRDDLWVCEMCNRLQKTCSDLGFGEFRANRRMSAELAVHRLSVKCQSTLNWISRAPAKLSAFRRPINHSLSVLNEIPGRGWWDEPFDRLEVSRCSSLTLMF